jgi:hypothetical protein
MQRKIFSWVFLVTGIVIGLGAFGHDSNIRHLGAEFAKAPLLDARVVAITFAVWHFCSGCMLAFGAMCVWAWWQLRHGARNVFGAPILVGVLYLVTGVATVLATGEKFFWLFAVLGALLLLSIGMLRRT